MRRSEGWFFLRCFDFKWPFDLRLRFDPAGRSPSIRVDAFTPASREAFEAVDRTKQATFWKRHQIQSQCSAITAYIPLSVGFGGPGAHPHQYFLSRYMFHQKKTPYCLVQPPEWRASE